MSAARSARSGWPNAVEIIWSLYDAGNRDPSGIWSDGTTIWVADTDDDKLYAYSLPGGDRDTTKDFDTLSTAGNQHPRGIWSDGETMWVADTDDDKLYAYQMSDRSRISAKDFNTLSTAGNRDPRGLWSNGQIMWVADSRDNKLYAYRMSDRSRISAEDFNTLSTAGNRDPWGIWSDGVTMWVADTDDDKLYAYQMSDRSRISAKDFNNLGDLGNTPIALWSDGESMYVSDDDSRIYKYIMIVPGTLNLSSLTINGTAVPSFTGDQRSYTLSDAYPLTADVTLAATAATNSANIAYSHPDALPGTANMGHQIGLSEGDNQVRIVVSGAGQASFLTYQLNLEAGDAPGDSTSKARITVDNETGPAEQFRGAITVPDDEEEEERDIDRINVTLTAKQLYAIILKGERFGDTDRTLHVPYIQGLFKMDVYQSGTAALGAFVSSGIDGRAEVLYRPSGRTNQQIDVQIVVSGALLDQTGTYDLRVRSFEDDHYPNGIGTGSTIAFPDDADDDETGAFPSARAQGRFNYALDDDWFRVSDLEPGETYIIEARSGWRDDETEIREGRRYVSLRVYDAEGEGVDVSHQGAKTVFRPPSKQDYYIRVFPGNRHTRHRYTLYLHPPLPMATIGGLSVGTTEIFDPDGAIRKNSVRYRWYRIGDDGEEQRIRGANRFLYVPAETDVGKRIFGRVCYRPGRVTVRRECRDSKAVTVEASGRDLPYDSTLSQEVEAGQSFRYLVVSAERRTARETEISAYNEWIQDQMRQGGTNLRSLADTFRAVVSTAAVSALDNTDTAHTNDNQGVPVFWIGGVFKVADHYQEFWTNQWQHRSPGLNSDGIGVSFSDTDLVWTGTDTDGSGSRVLGGSTATVGKPSTNSPVTFATRSTGQEHYLYGLSGVIRVTEPDVPYMLRVGGVEITSEPGHDDDVDVPGNDTYGQGGTIEFTLTFSEAVDVQGDPQFPFAMGDSRDLRNAAYQGGSGTTELVFQYTVQAADRSDGIQLVPTARLDSGSIVLDSDDSITGTGGGEDAVFFVPSSPDFEDHQVEGSLMTSSLQQQANSPATGSLEISGLVQVGQTLAVNSVISDGDGTSEATYAYQWLADDREIAGATSVTYTLTSAEQGKRIRARISFTDDAGHQESLTSAATAAVAPRPDAATGQPQITGTAEVGQTLSAGVSQIADTDGLTNAVYTYQWLAGDSEISGATTANLTLTSAATTAVARRPNSAATGQLRITGQALSGARLDADISGIEDANGLTPRLFEYQWIVVDGGTDSEIRGATRDHYRVASRYEGKPIKVRVSFTDNDGYYESLTSPESVPPRATGLSAVVSEQTIVLSWTRPAAFLYLFEYRIVRMTPELGEDSAVVTVDTGSSATSYTDANILPGVLYRYQVRAVNYWSQLTPASASVDIRLPQETGTDSAANSPDDAPANSPATGRPQITGTAQVGQTLSAGTSAIADADGLANAVHAYQWLAGGAEISGATASTFTLTAAQQGQTITVRVTFTDDAGHSESLTSAATSTVAAAPTPTSPPAAPTNLTGAADEDGRITLTWTAPDDASVTGYQILRRRPREGEQSLEIYVADTGSAATTYTDTSAPAGTLYVYRVKAINAAGVGSRSNYVNVDRQS